MRGIENIVRMRCAGRKPSVVWVEMLPMQQWARKLTEKVSKHVDIHMGEREAAAIDLADLRCLAGVNKVMVNGPDSDATEKVARACFRAGAKVVEAFWFNTSNPHRIEITKALRLAEDGEKVVWPR